jgi:hypothetical protein
MSPNVGVDAAARFHSSFAGPVMMRNTLPPLASNDLLYRVPVLQIHQSRFRVPKPTRLVETPQARLVINVQPFNAVLPSQVRRPPHEALPNPSPLLLGMHRDVEKEGVRSAIPGEVNEADQTLGVVGTDVNQTPAQHGAERRLGMARPGGREQLVQFVVGDGRVDSVPDLQAGRAGSVHDPVSLLCVSH